MQKILGFVTRADCIVNTPPIGMTPGPVATHFELSDLAMTYSLTRGEYQRSNYPDYVLHSFAAVDTDTGVSYVLPESQVAEVFLITQAVVAYLAGKTYPYDTVDLVNTIQAEYSAQIANFAIGELTVAETVYPDSLEWDSLTHPDTSIKLWLRNDAFENQYPDYTIVVVPPIPQIDRFFGTYGDLATELKAISITQTVASIQEAKSGHPETYTRAYTFNYVNPSNFDQKTPTNWGVLVYGKAGDNIDAIKDAIINYIQANSVHGLAEWEILFPEIFQRTEFLLYPRWDKIAIPNLTELAGLYSSIVAPVEALEFAKKVFKAYNASYLENNLNVIPFDYKAISVLVLNGQKNASGMKQFERLFPDYLPVGTSVLDFNRMSLRTQRWLLMVVSMLKTAETATEYTSLPESMRRIKRDGYFYLCQVYEGVNYLVALRANRVS